MRRNPTYLIAGLIGAVMLGIAIMASYWNHRLPMSEMERIAIGEPITKRQALARRRAGAGVVAVANATVQ